MKNIGIDHEFYQKQIKTIEAEIIELEDYIIDERNKGIFAIEGTLKSMYAQHRTLMNQLKELRKKLPEDKSSVPFTNESSDDD